MIVKGLELPNWENIKREWRDADPLLLIFPIILMTIGGIAIYSSDFSNQRTDWWQHWVTGGVGLAVMFAIARLHYDQLRQIHWFLYGITILSLGLVMFIGTTALGAERWISIGGFNIQPSEFAKVSITTNNIWASDFYKKIANKGRVAVNNGYYVLKVEMIPPTDPHVQQVILQMRKQRFRE